ncbi:MAG: hypothetical protein PF569_09290 [Candidatus Woesearchaeota archaeon]|jgi:hypothetical protein|nr:hypothetical protein [Candidatus Woesearchaeota archaeon]
MTHPIIIHNEVTKKETVSYSTSFNIILSFAELLQIMEGAKELLKAPTSEEFKAYVYLCNELFKQSNFEEITFKYVSRETMVIWGSFLQARMIQHESEEIDMDIYVILDRTFTNALSITLNN